jgi:hypothetical protein
VSGAALRTTKEALEELAARTGRSQADRATEFGEDLYHATGRTDIGTADNPNFLIGSHLGGTAEAANYRVQSMANAGMIEDAATMYPLKVDVKNPFEIDDVGRNHKVQDVADAMAEAGLINGEEWWSIVDKAVIDFSTGAEDLAASQPAWERAREILAESGYDSLSYVNSVEDAGSEVIMPLYQDQVRGRWAQFDPDKKLSPSLMAGSAGAAVLVGSENSEASEGLSTADALAAMRNREAEGGIPAMDGGDGLGTIETVLGYWNQFNRGVTMGGSDEIVARGRAALDEWIDERTGAGKIIEDATGDPYKDLDNFSEVVKMYEKDERIRRDAFLDANPISGTLMEIAGSMVTGGATFKAISALAPAAGMGIRGAGAGLIDGAIYGFLDGDGTVAERFENSAKLAGMGLALGAAAPKALEVLGKGAAAAGSKISKFPTTSSSLGRRGWMRRLQWRRRCKQHARHRKRTPLLRNCWVKLVRRYRQYRVRSCPLRGLRLASVRYHVRRRAGCGRLVNPVST